MLSQRERTAWLAFQTHSPEEGKMKAEELIATVNSENLKKASSAEEQLYITCPVLYQDNPDLECVFTLHFTTKCEAKVKDSEFNAPIGFAPKTPAV